MFFGLLFAISEVVEDLHSGLDVFLYGRLLLGTRNRSPSHENVVRGAIYSCGSTFHFLEKSKKPVIELGVVAVKVLHLLREKACTKSKKPVQNFPLRGTLFNLADGKYTGARETAFCKRSLQTQIKAQQNSLLEARGVETVALRDT